MVAAKKGKESVHDGIEWMRSLRILVHPRCKHTIEELTRYHYKVDARTGDVLPVLEDANNHCIDAIRYACEAWRKPAPLRIQKSAIKRARR